ncbi:hypothetical protein KJF94_18725 [Pseudomonas hormoni]|uniref:Uncharacterized protein n=1 Tax=Pseudomonas hormoni TaxID=3093767 RepID=A0ABX8EQG5_9PSED|nr:hypothetical protein [Pseudomonas hormoni]QVW21914.1 hypothetical protein KJF94_18725 [Pseudomonas hormoni]
MSRIQKKITGIRKTTKLNEFKYLDLWKSFRSSLGAELDLIILLAETPENCVDLDWERMQPTDREL